MAFTSKNLHKSSRGGLNVLKGATLFFLGMSCVMFLTRAYLVIQPSAANTQTVFEKLILTLGGDPIASTGVYLDGSGGDAYFAGNVGIGVNSPVSRLHINGEMRSNSIYVDTPDGVSIGDKYIGGLNEVQGIFFQDGTSLSDVIAAKMLAVGRLLAGDNIRVTTGGNVGIGTTNPNQKFEVAGNMRFTTDGYLEAGTNPNQLYLKNNGNVGIGTTNPSEKFEVNVNGTDYIQLGLLDGINTPFIGSNTGLQINAGVGKLLHLYGNDIKLGGAGYGMHVWNYMLPPTTRVSINSDVMPADDLYVNGKSSFGDKLKAYSDAYDGIIQTDGDSKIQFNTNGINRRMTINASGYVGINQTSPTANLDVVGTVKMLSSMKYGGTAGNGSAYTGGGSTRYFPEGVLTGSLNDAISSDTIRYLSCNTMSGGFLMAGFTGSNISIVGLFSNVYFLLPGQLTTTYNLKAGETFAVLNGCDDKLLVYRQNIGKDLSGTPPSSPYIDIRLQTAQSATFDSSR